ncbi:MAG TPA: hypothetical protein VL049_23570 [Candidatus Dormibacteraeota bacterium]|nr:hypothetical protein [Candidatus Dormibacteraeota bacterium]
MLKLWAAGISVACVMALGRPRDAAAQCLGDCDGSGMVTVGELVTGVNIALGSAMVGACAALDANGDGQVQMDELIRAVSYLLDGCPVTATTAGIVFGAENNRLFAYQGAPGFPRQVVIPSDADAPGQGRDVNGQICFAHGPLGQVRFIAGEDTNQGPLHSTAGWGLFELGGAFPNFTWQEINHLQPTYQPVPQGGDEPENYGCGFLSDGRLLTTDVGSQASGEGTGQLVIWFPPLDGGNAHYCKLDVGIATAQQIAVDDQDRVYVASARTTGASPAGIWRYTGPFPTSDAATDGCGRVDPTGAPLVSDGRITKERFIPSDGNIQTPGGVVLIPGGGFYVASVVNGFIGEYDADGKFVRQVLKPPHPGIPAETGNPIGLGLASDGTLYFADIGLQLYPGGGIGPGDNLGTVRRLRFVDGVPQLPEIMNSGLNFPDGIGILEPAQVPGNEG